MRILTILFIELSFLRSMAHKRWGGGEVWVVVTSSCISSLKIVVASFLVQFSMTALLMSAGEFNG